MARTTVAVDYETHRQLERIKYETRSRTFDETIQELIENADLDT